MEVSNEKRDRICLFETNSTKLDSSISSTCNVRSCLWFCTKKLDLKKKKILGSSLKLDWWSITKNLLEHEKRRFKADKVGFLRGPCAVHIAEADRISIKTWSVVGTRMLSKKIRLKPDTAYTLANSRRLQTLGECPRVQARAFLSRSRLYHFHQQFFHPPLANCQNFRVTIQWNRFDDFLLFADLFHLFRTWPL